MTRYLTSGQGTECNPVNIGGITELFGNPSIKREKPYTIVLFPGGSVEISRCENGDYWVHVATDSAILGEPIARITDGRIDARGRYLDETNKAIQDDLSAGDAYHMAIRVSPA